MNLRPRCSLITLLATVSTLSSAAVWAQPNLTPYKPSGWTDKIVLSTSTGTRTDAMGITPTSPIYLDWAVINSGSTAIAAEFYTELYVDGTLVSSWFTAPPLDASYYTYVSDYLLGSLSSGAHTLRIKTDSAGVIVESNESDNEYTKTIVVTDPSSPSQPGSWVLPSSAFRAGQNGAEFRTDVRILNLSSAPVTVTATFYNQASGTAVVAPGFSVNGRGQASFDNILQSLFQRTLAAGAFGPIRFDSTGPIIISSSVNNVNACGTGATSGQWLPGIDATKAMTAGVIPQLAVSASASAGYRTNLVLMNPGGESATVTVTVRTGGGAPLASGTIDQLEANGFIQVPLGGAGTFAGVAGRTDANLWVEYTSNRPVLAFASVINNASGDPFAVVASPDAGDGPSGSWVLPSSAFRAGQNGAEFRTDVRILNLSSSPVTVTATFYNQAPGTAVVAPDFSVDGRGQVSFDNILQSLFQETLAAGAFGPIRFDSTGPIIISSSVNNVNACGTGATSGQWLPGIDATKAMTAGVIPQLAVSTSASAGYRTNLVLMNPGRESATVSVTVRTGGGAPLASETIDPLGANGFIQAALDGAGTFAGVSGRTDANLWVEYTSSRPVLALASVINNASGDPFAVVASPDASTSPAVPLDLTGTFSGTNGSGSDIGPMRLVLTQTGSNISGHGSLYLSYPYSPISVAVTGTVNGTTLRLAMQMSGGCYEKFSYVSITSATNDRIAGSYGAPLVCSGNFSYGTFVVVRQ